MTLDSSQPSISENTAPPLAVSVVIPTYNRAHLIVRAVRSVLENIQDGDEVIVVDDASTDNTAEILAPFLDRIRYLPMPHGGAGKTRNAGIRAARNPLVAFLDSDDEWFPHKLQMQRQLMAGRPDVLYCFSDFGVRLDSGAELRRQLITWHEDHRPWTEILGPSVPFSCLGALPPGQADFPVHVGDLYFHQMLAPYVATYTVVVRREEAGEALRYAEDTATFEDWECFGRLAGKGLGAYMDCETAWQWGHAGPRLTDANAMVRASTLLAILPRVWGSDPQFLNKHGSRYREQIEQLHLTRAKCLLHQRRTREVREYLAKVHHVPALYRVLAALPGFLVNRLLHLRQARSGI